MAVWQALLDSLHKSGQVHYDPLAPSLRAVLLPFGVTEREVVMLTPTGATSYAGPAEFYQATGLYARRSPEFEGIERWPSFDYHAGKTTVRV